MTRFESDHVQLNASCEKVYHFLSDFRNLESLMPDQITNWKATEDECSFTIRGLADLSMGLGSKSACSNIHIVSKGKNPIDYSLDYFFSGKNDHCRVTVMLDAELNAFLRGIASRPLQNLVDMIADKLCETFP
jgi:carbon monoxide dehydrogenase subunit G